MKDHHVLVSLTGDAQTTNNAILLVEAALIAMGAEKPYKIWGNAKEAQGVLTWKDTGRANSTMDFQLPSYTKKD